MKRSKTEETAEEETNSRQQLIKTQAATSYDWKIGCSHKLDFSKAEKLSQACYGASEQQTHSFEQPSSVSQHSRQWWSFETWSRSREVSRDPFFGVSVSVSKVSGLVSVSVSKDFSLGLEFFVSRLCMGYFLWSFARRRSLKKTDLKNYCSKFSRSKRSVAKLSLLLCCLRDGENNLPSTLFKIYTEFNKNVHVAKKPQRVISAAIGWEYFAKDYLWTVFPRILL